MVSRRSFIQQSSFASMAIGIRCAFPLLTLEEDNFSYESPYLKFKLNKRAPVFSFFATDSLGQGQFPINPVLRSESKMETRYVSRVSKNSIAYYLNEAADKTPIWECKVQPKVLTLIGHSSKEQKELPFSINFSQKANHCTVLGTMQGKNQMRFPCLLHFPGMGTLKVSCNNADVTLFYDADRYVKDPFVCIDLQGAGNGDASIIYQFESVAIFPAIESIKGDSRFDGFRRNYINIFQMNPRIQALANNSASDACAFTLFLYAEMARNTPELVKGFTALHMVRDTLNQYLGGMKAYGQIGYKNVAGGWASEFDSLDSAPSLIISACYYIQRSNDLSWAKINYDHLMKWAVTMMATDRNKDGIIEYGYSGNSGSWDGNHRPANWWDTIGFGHDDAYSNALAYKACSLLKEIADSLGKATDANILTNFSLKLKSNYFDHFYNQQSGVLAGWKSKDGKLHDYYFTFVNSIAICYGLVEDAKARKIMERILQKMKEVGYNDFRLGLPGNLIPIPTEDYTDFDKRFGYDSFQVYENGGATGCYAYFTIHALYKLGMDKQAQEILMAMLESYRIGGFQGNCPDSDMTKDWKSWDGKCWGYEGFLVDNFLALLAVKDYKK